MSLLKFNVSVLTPYLVLCVWLIIAAMVASVLAWQPEAQGARIFYTIFLCINLCFISVWPYSASVALGHTSTVYRSSTFVGILSAIVISLCILTKNTTGFLPTAALFFFFSFLFINIHTFSSKTVSKPFLLVLCLLILFPIGVFSLNSWVRKTRAHLAG